MTSFFNSFVGCIGSRHPNSLRSASLLALLLAFSLSGCLGSGSSSSSTALVQSVDLADVSAAAVSEGPVSLEAAKNEWVDFTIKVSGLAPTASGHKYALRFQALNLAGGGAAGSNADIGADALSAYQVLNMPIDVNQAGYIRHTGLSASRAELPRALLPLKVVGKQVDLAQARDPKDSVDPAAHAMTAAQPINVWVDLHIPPEAKAGQYTTTVDIIEGKNQKPIASLPVRVNVYDFVLSDERHLQMVGSLAWDDLSRHYTDQFEAVAPRLLSRTDKRYAVAMKTLDQLVTLAQDNRVQLVIPRLQPTVKWPAAPKPPQFDWSDYDSVVTPWLKGEVFRDKIPVGYWPLPVIDHLANFDLRSRKQYYAEAAAHFDQLDWLARSAVVMDSPSSNRVDSADALRISGEAAQMLDLNQRLRVEVPLEDDQVQFTAQGNPNLIRPETASRLITANPGLVFSSPIRSWPNDVDRPARWLRTDLAGLIPYVGAGGDERDVRLWAFLATVPLPQPAFGVKYGPVQLVRWPNVLPRTNKPTESADPNDLTWFYPGSWFGVDEPLPSIQLKWLRRAQQDYEYLYLAKQRGETLNALVIARLMSKPVELQPTQQPDPTFGLMTGTADPAAWVGALKLLADRIESRVPGQPIDENRDHAMNLDLNRWAEPQERPVAMGRTVNWLSDSGNGVPSLNARLGIDIYNDADRMPEDNTLSWTSAPLGWHYKPQPRVIAQLGTYHVARFSLDASLEPSEIKNLEHKPLEITFTDGYTHAHSEIRMVLPAAFTDRRQGRLLKLDGSLDDWSPDDQIQNGPLTIMFNRPALQKQQIQQAATPSSIYTGWVDDNFYVAFKVGGVSNAGSRTVRNDVNYDPQFRRAWGEDVCEIIVQPVYEDNTLGPLTHLVCKPGGQIWIERMMNKREFVDPWQAFEGTGTRYAARVDGPDWRGELAIPWNALNRDPKKGTPTLLRFNFSQHKTETGESASWAGPVDFGRDEDFTGVLIVRDPKTPGM